MKRMEKISGYNIENFTEDFNLLNNLGKIGINNFGVYYKKDSIKDYIKQTKSYRSNLKQRPENLYVKQNVPFSNKPITYILVIGESASRDYIHAFGNCDKNSSPWLSELSKQDNCIIFPNAYSCHQQTVPVLEKALTESNQYNGKPFYESCSIVDIAKKAGFKVSWFSNQSHVGSADTAVTLVARTSDVSEWTVLHLNQPQYDETLLDYLKQIKDYFDNELGKDNAISIALQPQIDDTEALQKSYDDTINRFKSSCGISRS